MASEETYAKAEAAGKTALTDWFNTPPPGGGNPHTMMIRAACDVGIAEGRRQAAEERRRARQGPITHCHWCGKNRRAMSEWEQQNLSGTWHRLCEPCARRRLNNPWNALLNMRKIGTQSSEEVGRGA